MSFLAFCVSTPGCLIFLGLAILIGAAAVRSCQPAAAGPDREPAPSPLTPAEQAMLASLAIRYAHGDPRAGWKIADDLRRLAPAMTDADIMRCVVYLAGVARWFNRDRLTATDALAAYLHEMGAAALQLGTFERNEIPR